MRCAPSATAKAATGCWGRWLWASAFYVVRSTEYWQKWQLGLDFANNAFDMLYVMLTGFHFLHALVGCVLLFAMVWAPTRSGGDCTPDNCSTLETVTVFWHMVDLLWMILFPLVYVLR